MSFCSNTCAPAAGSSAYVDMYNATSNRWIRYPEGLAEARYYLAASSLPSGLVLFAGGLKTGAFFTPRESRVRCVCLHCKSIMSACGAKLLLCNSTAHSCASDGSPSAHVDIYNDRFSANAPTSLCPFCVAGSVVNLNGFGCIGCDPGTFNNLTGSSATACTACKAGTYNPSSRSLSELSCILCPAGTYNPSSGSTSASSCIPCLAGTYNPSAGSVLASSCIPCQA